MAANDEFPRGAVITVDTNTAIAPTLVFPASPGVAWVITHIEAQYVYLANAALANPRMFTTSLTDSLVTNYFIFLGPSILQSVANGAFDAADAISTWDGVRASPIGSAVTITINALGAGENMLLIAHGYAI